MTFPTFSSNAFNNVNPARGALAIPITESGILTGVVASGQTLLAGDRVKLNNAVTIPGRIEFTAAADNEAAFGVVVYTVKQDTFVAGDTVEVAFSGGQAVYEVAGGTLTPGTPVAMSASYLAAVDGTHLQMGLLLDYCTINTVGRVIVGFVAA